MKILVTIPHAFLPVDPISLHGSEGGNRTRRADSLLRCVTALQQSFSPGHRLLGPDDWACDTDRVALDIVLVTTGGHHLVDTLPPGLVHHQRTETEPRTLGFVCHDVLRAHAAAFDWFVYLEDDLEVTDSSFFDKLTWFNDSFGETTVLQPNRFEVSNGPVRKMFVDGALMDDAISDIHQDRSVRPRLVGTALGRKLAFQRVSNTHSGCFFVNGAQLERMSADPGFGHPNNEFVGPLESAATLPLMRSFELYKPARENASFLELRHLDQRMLDVRVRFRSEGSMLVREVS